MIAFWEICQAKNDTVFLQRKSNRQTRACVFALKER